MRQWVRCFVLTHCKFVAKLVAHYLKAQELKLSQWVKEVNKGCKADILALFILCIATDMHCFEHLKTGYWTTLLDDPQNHNEYSQRCNLHLSYLGKESYIQHEIHTETVAYDVFGLPEPVKLDMHTVSIAVGMCTADESETLDKLL